MGDPRQTKSPETPILDPAYPRSTLSEVVTPRPDDFIP
jgi:hypothetical protein